MEVRPVKSYKAPDYPDEREVQAHPELLERLPERWRANPMVIAALGMCTAAMLAGCGAKGEDGKVAPLFLHGGGSMSTGCVSVVRTFFLSESEAKEIIRAEAELYGNLKLEENPVQADPDALRRADKPMDLITEDGKIGVEYVSAGDAAAWNWMEDGGSVREYNVKDAAEEHRVILAEDDREEQRAVSKGVLYDPCACSDLLDDEETLRELTEMSGEEQEEYFRKTDEEALRAQVRDFIDWLETQGVLAS